MSTCVYLVLGYLYFFTVSFGMWGYAFGESPIPLRLSNWGPLVHTFTYSLTFFMMIWSHIQTFKTCAGFLPKGFEMIEEAAATSALQMLIDERENSYYETVVKRKIRAGELPSFQQYKENKSEVSQHL